jgi:hypothetical protein
MLLPPSARPTSTYLGIAILCQKRSVIIVMMSFATAALMLIGADKTIKNVLMSVTDFVSLDRTTSKERSHFGHRQI